jgi:Flp pilus assembly protein TadD
VTESEQSRTIAALVENFDRNAAETEPTTVMVKPGQVISPTPLKRTAVIAPTTQSEPRTPVDAPVTLTQAVAAQTQPDGFISQLLPSELSGSWQAQKLTIMGRNFRPDSEALICWPAKCVTLKSYRVNYISPNEISIMLTTGTREERWHLTVINADGTASNAREFLVHAPAAPTPSVSVRSDPASDHDDDNAESDFRGASKRIIPLSPMQQAEEHFLEANRLESEHKSAQAITLWEKAVVVAPEHHASRQMLIDKLIDAARTVEAEGYIQQAIKRFPNHPIYVQKLAQIRISQGDGAGAITLIESSIQKGVVNAELYAFAGALYQRERDYQKSIEHYQRALTLRAQSGAWWMGLGISLQKNGQESEALSAFQQAQNSGTLSNKLMSYVDSQIEQLNKKGTASKPN